NVAPVAITKAVIMFDGALAALKMRRHFKRCCFWQKLPSFTDALGLAHFHFVFRKPHVEARSFLRDFRTVCRKPISPLFLFSLHVLLSEIKELTALDSVR